MMYNVTARITGNSQIADSVCRIAFKTDKNALADFSPGQFADIKIPGRNELILRRPFSIAHANTDSGEFTIIYQIVGEGTKEMTRLKAGDFVEALLPLGKGFSLKESDKKVYLVAGGMGIAPLLSVPGKWTREYRAFLGYRNSGLVYCAEEMKKACGETAVATEDGSAGFAGYVTELLKESLEREKPDLILACGPVPMLHALKELTVKYSIPAKVSMEERMGCGFGACAVCVCEVKCENGFGYKKVCTEGPVFDINEVVL